MRKNKTNASVEVIQKNVAITGWEIKNLTLRNKKKKRNKQPNQIVSVLYFILKAKTCELKGPCTSVNQGDRCRVRVLLCGSSHLRISLLA